MYLSRIPRPGLTGALLLAALAACPSRAALQRVSAFNLADDPPGEVRFVGGLKDAAPAVRGGNVTFQGNLSGSGITAANDTGHWTQAATLADDPYVNVMREGNAAPGVAGATFAGFTAGQLADPANINAAGQTAFVHAIAGAAVTTANDTGLWVRTGSLQLVAREGAASPIAGVVWGNFALDNGNVLINPAGETAFQNTLGTGATTANDTTYWHRSAAGALTLVAREGSPAPGVAGGLIGSISGSLRLNDVGQVGFQAAMTGVSTAADTGIWAGTPGAVALVVREGDPLETNVNVGHISAGSGWSMRNTGNVAFACSLTGSAVTAATDSAILTGTSTRLFILAREGDDAPGIPATHAGGPFFGTLTGSRIALTAGGRHVFTALLTGTGVSAANDSGLWMGRSRDQLRLIAREGDQAPGFPEGVNFGSFATRDFHANAGGQCVFYTTVSGSGITTANDEAIYATDPMGFPVRIAWEHQDPDQNSSTGTSFRLLEGTSAGQDGRRSAITDNSETGYSLAGPEIVSGGAVIDTELINFVEVDSSIATDLPRSVSTGESYQVENFGAYNTSFDLLGSTDVAAEKLTVSVATSGGRIRVMQGSTVTADSASMAFDGELHIGAGSRVTCAGNFDSGFSSGAASLIEADGTNAVLEVGGTFGVGTQGQATLRVSNGAKLAGAVVVIPMQKHPEQGTGRVEISGATSMVEVTELFLGKIPNIVTDEGVLAMSGGTLTANELNVGAQGSVHLTGGTLTAETLAMEAGGTVAVAGGTLAVTQSFVPGGGLIMLDFGTVELPAGTVLTGALLDALLGPDHRLQPGQRLRIPGTADLQTFLTLAGGVLDVDSLADASAIRWESGTLLLADTPLTVGPGGPLGTPLVVSQGQTLAVSGAGRVLTVAAGGQLLIDGGSVHSFSTVNAGEVRLSGHAGTLTGSSLSNTALLRGSGYLDFVSVTSGPAGQIRAFPGDHLVISADTLTNNGLLDANGGILEIISAAPVQNNSNSPGTGLITARNSMLIFSGGLTNTGSMAFSTGAVDVFGKITNAVLPGPPAVTGRITVSGGGTATFYDDVVNSGIIQVSSAGTLRSTAVFFGSFSGNGVSGGGNVFLEGDTRPGFSPGTMAFGGDVAFGPEASLKIELGGRQPGTQYDRITAVRTMALGGTMTVTLIDGFTPAAGDAFDVLDATAFSGGFASVSLPPLPAGLFWRTDRLTTTGELAVSVSPESFAEYAAFHGLSGEPLRDTDGDGADDATEYAFGTSPVAGMVFPELRLSVSGDSARLSFDLPALPGTDAVVVIESSTNLAAWTELVTRTGSDTWTGPLADRLQSETASAGYERWTLPTDAGQRTFFRLRASVRE